MIVFDQRAIEIQKKRKNSREIFEDGEGEERKRWGKGVS